MQTLYFEAAWEKTLAPNDREKMVHFFEKVKPNLNDGVHFTYLWSAHNHKNEILITTLIHNVQPKPLELVDTIIAYKHYDKLEHINKFYVPEIIPAYKTMPWTLIFSKEQCEDNIPDYIIQGD